MTNHTGCLLFPEKRKEMGNSKTSCICFIFLQIYTRDHFQKRKTAPASWHSVLTGPDVTCFSLFLFFWFGCQLFGCLCGGDAWMMQEAVMGTWLNSSRRKNNMPLWISHSTAQCVILLLLFLAMNVLFLSHCVFFVSLSTSLALSAPSQHSLRVPRVHSRSAGSSPPASGLNH